LKLAHEIQEALSFGLAVGEDGCIIVNQVAASIRHSGRAAEAAANAIVTMQTRGAPLIGVVGGLAGGGAARMPPRQYPEDGGNGETRPPST
jgi:hypothetical protein